MCHKDARPNCAIKKEKGDEMYYGKTIQFEDVNASDVGEDFSVSLEYKYPAGTNITIKAKVGKFNSNTGIFCLEPISITER